MYLHGVVFLTLLTLISCETTKKCYSCQGNCSESTVTECPNPSDNCFAYESSAGGVTLQSKGCITPESSKSLCENNPKCYTCDFNLCNTIIDPGVRKCYVCIDECPSPPLTHDCFELLTVSETRVVKAACLSYEIKRDNVTTISKGCIPDNAIIRQTCFMTNVLNREVTCKICNEELCNGEEVPVEENFAEECYSCSNNCELPLSVEKCEDGSKCVALEASYGGQNYEFRGCVQENDQLKANCTLVNQFGGNCTICETNLCNGVEEVIHSVDECYHCETDCDEVEVIKCRDVLGDKIARCIAAEIVEDDGKREWRGCVENTDENYEQCESIKEQGGNCTICDSNLCNVVEEGDDGDDKSDEDNNSSLRNEFSAIFFVSFLVLVQIA